MPDFTPTCIPASLEDTPPPRLLVVDDDAAIRELHALILNLEGYEVETACDGAAALELLAVKAFNLVITDRATPILNGASMELALRSAGSDIPIIMVSSLVEESPLPPKVVCEISATLPKPARTAEILWAVAHALRGSSPPKRPRHFPGLLKCEIQTLPLSGPVKRHRNGFRLKCSGHEIICCFGNGP